MRIVPGATSAVFVLASVFAQAQVGVAVADREAIQSLAARYATALSSCDAEVFADLFEPESGFFASGFRGKVEGRERLIALVESERHCLATESTDSPADRSRGRPGGQSVPTVSLETNASGIFGVIDLGALGQYQDEYVRTADGWRFASRTVVTPAERAAGLDARQMAAIRELSAEVPAHDHYAAGENGQKRFLSSGVVLRVESGAVSGRVYLEDGGHYDDVYERSASGTWRIRSRELIPAAAN
jgi:hypothetical protein